MMPVWPKPIPHVVKRLAKRRKVARMDRAAKEQVRQRDMESCRICGRRSRGVHERVFKSRGGVASLDNSLVLCSRCHEYTHGHAIKPHGESCNGPMAFEMSQEVAQQIFRGMAIPPHVTVVQAMTEEVYPPED